MTMTIADLLRDLNEQLENGVDPETPVLIALQEHYPLVSTLRTVVAVHPLWGSREAGREDEPMDELDEEGEEQEYEIDFDAPCSHLLLAEGSQRSEWNAGETGSSPYTTPAEDVALESVGWGRRS